MPKQPNIKIGDRIRRRTDDGKVYVGTCIKLTEKAVYVQWMKCDRDQSDRVLRLGRIAPTVRCE